MIGSHQSLLKAADSSIQVKSFRVKVMKWNCEYIGLSLTDLGLLRTVHTLACPSQTKAFSGLCIL